MKRNPVLPGWRAGLPPLSWIHYPPSLAGDEEAWATAEAGSAGRFVIYKRHEKNRWGDTRHYAKKPFEVYNERTLLARTATLAAAKDVARYAQKPEASLYTHLPDKAWRREVEKRGDWRKKRGNGKRKNPLYTPGGFEEPEKYTAGHGLPKELRGSVPNVDPEGTDLSIWRWTENGKLYAIAFQARSTKPLWYHRFSTPERMAQHISSSIEARRASLERKEAVVARRKVYVSPARAGDVYYTSGGYDQTNVSFFQVVKVSGKTAEVRPVASRVDHAERGADYVVAVPGKFVGPSKRVVLTEGGFKVGYRYASAWDGRPKYETASGWGH